MKKLFKNIFFATIAVGIFLITGFAHAESKKSDAKDFCGNPNKVLFTFKDGTKFLIPEPYLYSPYKSFNRIKENAEIISILALRKDFMPDCNKQSSQHNENRMWISTAISPTIHFGDFVSLKKTYDSFYPIKVKPEKQGFETYRAKKDVEKYDLSGTSDKFVPEDTLLKNSIFAKCAHPSNGRFGCTIYQEITDKIYTQYNIHYDDLENLNEISKNVSKLILAFKVD